MTDISEINRLLKSTPSIDSKITNTLKASQIAQQNFSDLTAKLAATAGFGFLKSSEFLRIRDSFSHLKEARHRDWDIPELKGLTTNAMAVTSSLDFLKISEHLRDQQGLSALSENLNRAWGTTTLKGLSTSASAALSGFEFINNSGLLDSQKRLASLSQNFHAASSLSELGLIKSSGILEVLKQRESLLSAWNTDDLIRLRNLPDSFVHSGEGIAWAEEVASYTPDELQELYDDTAEAISKDSNFQSLTLASQKVVLYILGVLFAGVVSFFVTDYLNQISGAKTVLVGKSFDELKAIALGKPVRNIDRSVLRGLRFVHSDGLKLRYDPVMKSEVITVLPRGTLLTVLDKTQRSWIQVSVELNGEEEIGWVGRRYTSYFK